MKRSVMAILMATVIMVSFLGPLLYISMAADPVDWYMTVPGVLNSDYYELYPYEKKNLTIGISKFGEMIDANTKKGLEYDGIDAFAADPYVPEFEWNQGWLINIIYSYAGEYRNVWAFALYSDSYKAPDSIGGDWKWADAPDSTTILGGRKYGGYRFNGTHYIPIGYASTKPLEVIYNGPRRFIAISNNTIGEDATQPLVRVLLTFIFNKVKKYVIVLKDIKLLDTRKFTGKLQVEFSNRGEWDLGKTTAPASRTYFFDNLSTCYHEGWHPFYKMPDNNANYSNYDVAQIISTNPTGYVGFAAFWPSLVSKYIEATMYIDRKIMLSSLETYRAVFEGDGETVAFQIAPPGNPSPIVYPRGMGNWSDNPMVFVDGKIRPENATDPLGYTWNTATDTVTFNQPPADGALIWFVYKQYVHKIDMSVESGTPYVIGEWDFDLSWINATKSTHHFRGVTVYGMVDNHDAIDNVQLDRELRYQLDEVFNPWSLVDAVHKSTSRYVHFEDGPIIAPTDITLDPPPLQTQWDGYCNFSERVILLPNGTLWERGVEYLLTTTGIRVLTTVPADYTLKILWSSLGMHGGITYGIFTDNANNAGVFDTPDNDLGVYLYNNNPLVPIEFYIQTPAVAAGTDGTLRVYAWEVDRQYYISPEIDAVYLNGSLLGILSGYDNTNSTSKFHVPPDLIAGGTAHFIQIFVDCSPTVALPPIIDPFDSTTWPTLRPTANWGVTVWGADLDLLFLKPRYEWITVGNHSRAIDSAGAALVSAALKNKQVEIGLSGLDVQDIAWGPDVPFLLSNMTYRGTGRNPAIGYYDSIGRLALKDDWCTTWPIASSNIIVVGGPPANILAEYFNEFTDAFITKGWPIDAIYALPCWSKNYYLWASPTGTEGHAIISTYKDLNGTVGLIIYGWTGQDTYYACKWFHEEGIIQLQTFPSCVTTIVLEIDYCEHEPVVSVVECLGTISETLVHGNKGGIHPDP